MSSPLPARAGAGAVLALSSIGFHAAAQIAPSALVSFRLSPPEACVYESLAAEAPRGSPAPRELPLSPGANGSRVAALARGRHELIVLAPGYSAARFSLEASSASVEFQAKLERAGSPLRHACDGRTGARPKSVSYTPDGRYLVLPLLSGGGAELLSASSLSRVAFLAPPASYAKAEGFVESACFPAIRELWVSQMHNSMIHAFDLDTFEYKASFPSGGAYPKVICPSADGKTAFVTNWVSEDLAAIDVASRALLYKVKLGGTPRGLAASADGRWLYIARFAGGSILRLSLADRRLSTLWPADGGAKRHLVLDEVRGRLYATDMGRDSLFAIEAATGALVAELRLGPNPNGCALSPDGRTIYACTRGTNGARGYELEGPDSGELIAVDAESLRVVARQWGGDQPTGLAVSPDGSRVALTDFLDRRVEAYDIEVSLR